ncbi:MAG: CPBP family intramembrane glutamic endopeptidase [Planctomycetota bacterium]
MEQPTWATVVEVVIAVASIALLVWLAVVRRGRGSLLPFEPRRPVPWGPGVGLIAAMFVVLNVLSVFAPQPLADAAQPEQLSSEAFVSMAVSGSIMQLILVVMGGASVVFAMNGDWRDLGLPRDLRQFAADARLGLLTALAAFAPVYGLQLLLIWALDWQPYHPTIEAMLAKPDWRVTAAAFLAAGVAAPVFEEFLYRLLFQGWLEKAEDEYLGLMPAALPLEEVSDAPSPQVDLVKDPNPYKASQVEPTGANHSRRELSEDSLSAAKSGGWFSLPHGWSPVLTSSICFGLAHLTHGPAPVSLVVFAIFLGYVYQRTHRIVPCIAAHMAFNVFSLALVTAVGWSGAG